MVVRLLFSVFVFSLLLIPALAAPTDTFTYSNFSHSRYYGSGDANNDGVVNQLDIDICRKIAKSPNNKTAYYFTEDPNATVDACDVDADGVVTMGDVKQILWYFIGRIDHLPAHWDKCSVSERMDWIYKIERRHASYPKKGVCGNYANQLRIAYDGRYCDYLAGLPETYNMKWQGRFNIPLTLVYCENRYHMQAITIACDKEDLEIHRDNIEAVYHNYEQIPFNNSWEGLPLLGRYSYDPYEDKGYVVKEINNETYGFVLKEPLRGFRLEGWVYYKDLLTVYDVRNYPVTIMFSYDHYKDDIPWHINSPTNDNDYGREPGDYPDDMLEYFFSYPHYTPISKGRVKILG